MENAVGDFLVYLDSEKGLSPHTLESYGRDLKGLRLFLEGKSLEAVGADDIIAYFEVLKKKGAASSSLSERLWQ